MWPGTGPAASAWHRARVSERPRRYMLAGAGTQAQQLSSGRARGAAVMWHRFCWAIVSPSPAATCLHSARLIDCHLYTMYAATVARTQNHKSGVMLLQVVALSHCLNMHSHCILKSDRPNCRPV